MHIVDTIQVRSNLNLTLRERGKIKSRRSGHNIFLNLGREWLPKLVGYSVLPAGAPPPPLPVTPEEDARIRYMGVGIGGVRQLQLGVANAPPMSVHYPGTNARTDTDPTVIQLERPVRLSSVGAPIPPPYAASDVWLGQVQAPTTHPIPTSVTFKRVFTELEISYGPFLTVPLAEVMLFLHSPNPTYIHLPNNTGIAYDTFDTLSKTNAFALEIDWTLRF